MKKVTILALLLNLISCSTDNELDITQLYKIEDVKIEGGVELFKRAQDVEVIPLETSPECIISNIDEIKTVGRNIYIFDKRRQVIFQFDDKGNFKNKIDKRGRSASEYLNLVAFDVDSKSGDILLLDNASKKILIFSADCEFVRTINLTNSPRHLVDAIFVDSNNFCLIAEPNKDDNKLYMLHFYNGNGDLHSSMISFPEYYSDMVAHNNFGASAYMLNDTLNVKFLFDNRIFSLTKDELMQTRELVFDGYDSPIKLERYAKQINEEGIDYLLEHTNICVTGNRDEFIETNEMVLTSLHYDDYITRYLYYDKVSNKSIIYEYNKLPLFGALFSMNLIFYPNPDGSFYTVSYPNNINKILSLPDDKINKGGDTNTAKLVSSIRNTVVDDRDNPVLIKFRL